MITLDKSIDAVNRYNNLDWQYFVNNGFTTFGFLLRLATDRGYVWKIAHGEATQENDNLLSAVATTGSSALATAGILGVNVIPVVGQVLSVVLAVSTFFDFSAFGVISDSTHRVRNLKEKNTYWQKAYTNPKNFGTPNYVIPSGFLSWINKLLLEFPPQLPKCVSPTANCSKEHKQFQTKIELHLEAIENVLILYSTYFNPEKFQEFISIQSDASTGSGSGGGGGGSSIDNKSLIIGIAVLIVILIMFFVKG